MKYTHRDLVKVGRKKWSPKLEILLVVFLIKRIEILIPKDFACNLASIWILDNIKSRIGDWSIPCLAHDWMWSNKDKYGFFVSNLIFLILLIMYRVNPWIIIKSYFAVNTVGAIIYFEIDKKFYKLIGR